MNNQSIGQSKKPKQYGVFHLIGGAILLFVIFSIIIASFEDEGGEKAHPSSESIQLQTFQEQQIQNNPIEIKQKTQEKKKWETTAFSWIGDASKIYANTPTEDFKMDNNWRIKWYVTPKDKSVLEGGSANFSIKVYRSGSEQSYDVPIIWPIDTDRRTGTSASYHPGTYLLKINALGVKWVIDIEELK